MFHSIFAGPCFEYGVIESGQVQPSLCVDTETYRADHLQAATPTQECRIEVMPRVQLRSSIVAPGKSL
jgi:hypothetical protein